MVFWQVWWSRTRRRLRQLSWAILAGLGVVHLLLSYALMGWCGEANLTQNPSVFFYYYITTATTIGYGDLSPQSPLGRFMAALFVLPGAVALFAALLGKVTTLFIDAWRRSMTGKNDCSTLRGHTVVVGWRGSDTNRLIDLLLLDSRTDDEGIVVVDTACEENPRADVARYVRIESFASPEPYLRAGLAGASRIVIDTPTDEQTLAAVFAVLAQCPGCATKVKARFAQETTARLVRLHHPEVETITPLDIQVLVRATQDSGSADVAADLLSLGGGQNQYSLVWSGSAMPYEQACQRIKSAFDASVIGLGATEVGGAPRLNPSLGTVVEKGATVFYIAASRLVDQQVAGLR